MSSTSSKRCAPATVLEIVISARSSASSGRSGRTRGSAAGVVDRRGRLDRRAPPRSSTRSSAATVTGQNCVPALRRSSARAWSAESARRYGRSEVIACQASQTKQMRLASGTSSPASPSG